MQAAVKPCGFCYYDYMFTYIDNLLSISHNPLHTLKSIQTNFKFKNDKMEPLETYLDTNLSKI